MAGPNTVAYIWHKDYTKESDEFIPTENRNDMVHSLIESYGLLDSMMLVAPKQATMEEMGAFHSAEYLDHLKDLSSLSTSSDGNEFGLEYDCPYRAGLLEYCQRIAGGTMDAARLLCSGHCKVAIHWLGGWHHAKRDSAAGYCYVNDCVLGLLHLRKKFSRVLYVDLDLHHGDGVQDAFCGTDKVTTLSFHKYEAGFFPGTGSAEETGLGKGRYRTINVPLRDGICDANFCRVTDAILDLVREKIKPDAVLCQLGADGLNEDPMRSFNLTSDSLVHCTKKILNWGLPTLLLGGGGYNAANTARCWTSITSAVLGQEISNDIPEHDYFPDYGPTFELQISPSLRKDQNTKQYLDDVISTVKANLGKL